MQVHQLKGERSFHIFYQLVRGTKDEPTRKALRLPIKVTEFNYLNKSGCTVSPLRRHSTQQQHSSCDRELSCYGGPVPVVRRNATDRSWLGTCTQMSVQRLVCLVWCASGCNPCLPGPLSKHTPHADVLHVALTCAAGHRWV